MWHEAKMANYGFLSQGYGDSGEPGVWVGDEFSNISLEIQV